MSDRLLCLVSLWLRPDVSAADFEAFERKAAEAMAPFGGRVERAVRMSGGGEGAPFEVHLVSFPDAAGFDAYRASPAARALAAERERVIARTEILEGREAVPYLG